MNHVNFLKIHQQQKRRYHGLFYLAICTELALVAVIFAATQQHLMQKITVAAINNHHNTVVIHQAPATAAITARASSLADFLLLLTNIGKLLPATIQLNSIELHHNNVLLQFNGNDDNDIMFASSIQTLIPTYALHNLQKNRNNQLLISLKVDGT